MQSGADAEIELTPGFDDRPRALDTSGRTIEAGKHPVAGGFNHDPAVPLYLGFRRAIVRVE